MKNAGDVRKAEESVFLTFSLPDDTGITGYGYDAAGHLPEKMWKDKLRCPPGGFLPQPWNVRFPAVRTESARLFVLSGFSSRLSVTGKEIFLSTARTRAA
ncbi:hypothetical protein NXY40_19100 [Phocaeicola vulgatus]|nr:hypothetical protein [Phocaeicola vulgatus]